MFFSKTENSETSTKVSKIVKATTDKAVNDIVVKSNTTNVDTGNASNDGTTIVSADVDIDNTHNVDNKKNFDIGTSNPKTDSVQKDEESEDDVIEKIPTDITEPRGKIFYLTFQSNICGP